MTPLGQPDGAFYVYANVSRHGFDSRVLADRLLDRAGVAVTRDLILVLQRPSTTSRFSYTVEVGRIQEAFDRMANALGSAGSGG
jgi:aspartate/methionine/tyrosine aminotransferase